jgi:DNA-binding CsgD family transcriptional regulator
MHRKVLRGILPTNFDLLTHTKEGKEVWVNMSIIAVPRKRRPLALHLLRDVTKQKKDQEKLRHIRKTLGVGVQKSKARRKGGAVHSSSQRDAWSVLSRREVEVLSLLAEGISSVRIAQRLGISPYTVRHHIQNALRKLGLHSKAEAVSFAFRNGLL